ncbi:cysteine-rich protein 3 isoform X4 [Arvicola amphibius]|uniref:cysteine-rich protein 3 isoform X4 n=1 Tax=Arvicola amphibius TaxID=1047088 RepID=UPI0018E34963|nr:cysteine-rich protein 3 isoform X4 [Arvicola amphibius]
MSWTCPRCQQPVYFAEKVSSLGKNWHRFCLKCERCHSILSPGGHAEHNGRPYCHKPCYGALFGPRGPPYMKTFTGETSLCPGCGEPVYFAEKVMSLGRNWHRPCLRCQRCRKTLTAGSHAEHDGIPYCHIPCYGYLFGPKGGQPDPRHWGLWECVKNFLCSQTSQAPPLSL